MKQSSLYNPVKFFVITYAITFLSWSLAIYTSTLENGESVFILFLIPGMLAPFAAGALVGRSVSYQELIAFEPGIASMLMTALLFGALRNISRLVMIGRLRRS